MNMPWMMNQAYPSSGVPHGSKTKQIFLVLSKVKNVWKIESLNFQVLHIMSMCCSKLKGLQIKIETKGKLKEEGRTGSRCPELNSLREKGTRSLFIK